MTEFNPLRDELVNRRQELDQQRQAALLAHEALRRAEQALADFTRTAGPQQREERLRLEAELKAARTRAEQAKGLLEELRAGEAQLFEAFEVFTDPRAGLSRLPDSSPILLFPLRLETRFKDGPEGQPQLWVRVFPDTCLIDTFEPSLTEQETANARQFWAAVWRAGGDETLERAAWRDLAAAHSSGRAGWIVRKYLPQNPGDKPVKDSPADVLLIIPAYAPLPPEAAAYWGSVWRAEGDAPAQQAAYAALEAALGAEPARTLTETYPPFNLADPPPAGYTRATAPLKVAVLQLAPPEAEPARRSSWSSAPRFDLLPERFVLLAYAGAGPPKVEIGRPVRTPLIAGPDPNAPPDRQLQPVDDTLQIPDELAWMFDFERALEAGMAFRFDLTPAQARDGFERVIVLGVRLADSAASGRARFEQLLEHHLFSRPGLEIIPQGRPTNNTEKTASGYSFRDDPEATFDVFYRQTPQYTLENDPLLRRDGQWLAELLGLDHDFARRIPNAGGRDQLEARALQIALWPGTLGYMMKTLLDPVFSAQDIDRTRAFFTRYVSGRGPLPALRIGAQPYGILPTTAFGRLNGFGEGEDQGFAARLHAVLARITSDWRALAGQVSYLGKTGGDPHQVLLDVLGLHPASVEYYPLQADSLEHKFYELALLNFSVAVQLVSLFPPADPLDLLRSFGYTGEETPDLLNKLYKARQTPLTGPVIDDRPLSENEPVRAYAGGRNYIEWLVDAAQSGIEQIQQESGFDSGAGGGGKKPAALLYLLLRHALQLSFNTTAVRLQAEVVRMADVGPLLREPAFVHVAAAEAGSESRYDALFRPDARITGREDLLIGDYIARNLRALDPELREQIEALERLIDTPTARLERLFAEHIDTCSYRLDAWKTGLLALRLEMLRRPPKRLAGAVTTPAMFPSVEFPGEVFPAEEPPGEAAAAKEPAGLFLGAYGWLEPLLPEPRQLTPVELPEDLAEVINRRDKVPLVRDSANEGLIHAPSLNHATTAAVLRNGYLANDGRLAVNLSSRRVQLALGVLEGMRGGQPLGALLGYQFERHVHDHGPLQVRDLIFPLRRAFPLAAGQIAKTDDETGEAQEVVAALNVVDGRKLLEHAEKTGSFTYPFGLASLPGRPPAQENALTNALAYIRDINDAVADLVLAEGVHQAVLGNYDRSAGTLDAFAKGNYPPEPEVIRTPRSGIALTVRTAIHFSPAPPANPLPGIVPITPLAAAEPAVNAWLKDRLPAPGVTGAWVRFTDRATDAVRDEFITQEQLGLQPIDLLYRAETGVDQGLNALDDLILHALHALFAPRHDRPITIRYTARAPGRVNWFELQALLRSLRALVTASRPLQPADVQRANDAAASEQAAVALARARVEDPRNDLNNVQLPALTALETALANPAVTIDAALNQFTATVGSLAAYRLPQTGTGFVYEERAAAYRAVADKVAGRVATLNERLERFDARLADYDALPAGTPEEERVPLLEAAELLVRVRLATPPPANAAAYRAALNGARSDFVDKRDALQGLVDNARATLAQLVADAEDQLAAGALPPLAAFDADPLDFTDEKAQIERFRTDMSDAAGRLKDELAKRVAKVDALLAQHTSAAPAAQAGLLQEAAKILFGEDFQMVPQVTLPAAAADELANAWQHTAAGDLTRYLTDTVGRDFPVDDWLHGAARVREKLAHWENALVLGEALAAGVPLELTPLQLPYGPDEPWLALEIPDDYAITSERLLYSAHFAEPFDKTQPVCGLLVDEWTEVIPGVEETTGVAFHFDRPNAEPPQAWLLALPAVADGTWSWDELLDAVVEAFEAARLRALEPAHLDNTAYAWFLPATVSAYTFPEISISNNLLRNLVIYAKVAAASVATANVAAANPAEE